ncbi:MAG: hypothetical protein ACI4P5_01630 [Candidatus Fimadaptatus sp.]
MRGTRLWTGSAAPLSWGILRNIPLALRGALDIIIFLRSAKAAQDVHCRLRLTIVRSFAFCLPVARFADRFPLAGILMLPMTCAYVWTVLIGHNAMKRSDF